MNKVRQLALIVPWYGLDTAGGAERYARQLAENLHQAGIAISVLTTTSRDVFSPAQNDYYPAGWQEVNGVPVLRFPAWAKVGDGPKNPPAPLLPPHLAPLSSTERHMIDEFWADDGLYEYVAEHRQDTLFFPMPYIWGTSFWSALIAQERAILIPCLHDEPQAHYGVYQHMFQRARGALFNTLPEMQLAQRLYGLPAEWSRVIGVGLDMHWQGDAQRFRQKFFPEPFIFYAGRRDQGKRVPLLIKLFCAYKDRHPGPLKLALAGKNPVSIPLEFKDSVLDLGYLSEQDKHDAYAAATLVCNPSVVESFSLVIMEGWLQGAPVLVNAACDVTVWHCRESNGGLYFQDYAEFEGCLNYLLERPQVRERMGALGRAYVRQNYAWPEVMQRFIMALEEWGVPVPYRGAAPSPQMGD
ncbi:MAG: glycosyltransferase family 4 protein [Chloroflexia bacterium]|nr:glycosyltransferase family 4 protein [Chloroflexia bacterium]